jgi:hypothetical protein
MQLKKTTCATLIVAALAALSGCTSMAPAAKPYSPTSLSTERAALENMQGAWNTAAAERDGKAMMVLVTPFSVPKEIRSKQVRLELEAGATVKDFVAVMGNLGYSIILADEEAGDKPFYLPHFSGTVGSLLSSVSRATNVWFTWNDGTIMVSSSEKISLTLPQEETLGTKVSEGLKAMGLEKVATSWEAGMVTLTVTPAELSKVRAFLQRMTANAALVSLQVAIISVQMNQDAKQGVDWSKLQLAVGRDYAASGLSNMEGFQPIAGNSGYAANPNSGVNGVNGVNGTNGTNVNNGTTGTTPGTGTGTDPVAAVASKAISAMGLMGGGLKGVITNTAFSFTGLYDFLQTYGATDTKQNVVLKSVAGTTVELKSLTQTPYVESISVTSTGTSGTGNNGNNGTMGSAKTAKADDGLTLKMTPYYDAAANTVTVKLDLALKAVLGFNNLSAGNQIGQLSQPTTAERSFNDVLRVRPGQTVVVGGITYETLGRTGSAPIAASAGSMWEHKGLVVNRNAMFIVVRPTVVSLGQVSEAESLELFAPGQMEPEAVKVAKPVRPATVAKPLPATDAQVSKPAPAPSTVKVVSTTVTTATVTSTEPVKAASAPVNKTRPPVAVAKPSYDAAGYATVPLRTKE